MKTPELYTCIILKVAGKWYPTWKKVEGPWTGPLLKGPANTVQVMMREFVYNFPYDEYVNTYRLAKFGADPEYYMLFDESWDEKRALKVVAADILKTLYRKRGQWRAIRMWNKVLMD